MSQSVLRLPVADDTSSTSLSDIGERSGRLGTEIADMAGIVSDLTALGHSQTGQARAAARSPSRPMGNSPPWDMTTEQPGFGLCRQVRLSPRFRSVA